MRFLSADKKHSVTREAGQNTHAQKARKNLFAFTGLGNDSRALNFWKKPSGMESG
jgi:hypothetical protein